MPPASTTPPLAADPNGLIRLQKVLAAAGYGSRRHCEEFIQAGRVTVDGDVVRKLGRRVDPQQQKIQLDGETIALERKVYYILNKPTGCLCTHRDPAGRKRVIDLFPGSKQRLFTVGRLDENSEGLLLVTNDGEFANRLAHPRYRVARTYEVHVAGLPTGETLKKMREGLRFSDGLFRVQRAKRVRVKGKSAVLHLTLSQGRNREIRRLLARLGHKVMKLRRIQFGPLKLGRIKVGDHRELKPQEIRQLQDLLQRDLSRPRQGRKPSGAAKRSKRKSMMKRAAT